MIIVNTETITGFRIARICGLVQGNTVRAKHIGRDIFAGIKQIFGGELRGYTELLSESRDQALQRMIQQAQHLGANGIVNVRFDTSAIMQNASEILVYGTAVILENTGTADLPVAEVR